MIARWEKSGNRMVKNALSLGDDVHQQLGEDYCEGRADSVANLEQHGVSFRRSSLILNSYFFQAQASHSLCTSSNIIVRCSPP